MRSLQKRCKCSFKPRGIRRCGDHKCLDCFAENIVKYSDYCRFEQAFEFQ